MKWRLPCGRGGNMVIYACSRHQEVCAEAQTPTEWNTTVVSRKRDVPARETLFRMAARLESMRGRLFARQYRPLDALDSKEKLWATFSG